MKSLPPLALSSQKCSFLSLLPDIPSSGGLTPEHWLALSAKLRLAISDQSDSPVLSEAESQSFRQYCDIIHLAGIGLQLRNFSLLVIYETQLWRAEYQSVKDFAKHVADLSKSQLMKCIDAARIALQMAEAGLGDVAPRGRQIEELAKVPVDHRIPAWLAALEAFALHGNSVSEAKLALCNYCDAQNIRFGRREPNGSKKGGHSTPMQPDQSKEVVESPILQSENGKDWTESLSIPEDHTLVYIVNPDVLQDYFGEFNANSPGKVIAKILQEVGSDHSNAQTSKHMEAALSILFEKEPELAARLHKQALCHLANAISQKLLVMIDEARMARFASLEKDFPTIRDLLPSSILQFNPPHPMSSLNTSKA